MGLLDSLLGGDTSQSPTPSSSPFGDDFGNRLNAMFLAMASTPPGGAGGIPLLQATQVSNTMNQQALQRQASTWMLENLGGFPHDQAVRLGANPQIAQMAMNIGHSKQMAQSLGGILGQPDGSPPPEVAPQSPQGTIAPALPAVGGAPPAQLSPSPPVATPQISPPGGDQQAPQTQPGVQPQPTANAPVRPQVQAWQAKAQDVAQKAVGVQQTPQGPVAVDAKGRPLINLSALLKAGLSFSVGGWTDQERKTGENLMGLAQKMMESGVQPSANGGVIPLPGAAEAKARQAYMEGQGKYSARAQNTPMTVFDASGFGRPVSQFDVLHGAPQAPAQATAPNVTQPAGAQAADATQPPGQPSGTFTEIPKVVGYKQQQVAEYNTKIANEADGLSNQQQRLQEIQRLLQEYQTGKWAGAKGEFVAALNSLGADIGLKSRVTNTANPADYEVFLKDATKTVFDNLKQLGGRPLVSEIQGLSKSVMNPELQPDANVKIVGQLLGAVNGRMAHNQAFSDWYQKNQYATDYTPFENSWYKEHPYSGYVKEAERGTPALGQDIPPPTHRDPQTVYMTKLGPAKWDPASKVWTKVTQLPNGTWR